MCTRANHPAASRIATLAAWAITYAVVTGCIGDAAAGTLEQIGKTALWERAEFRVTGAASTPNNFDPDLIQLEAEITSPKKHVTRVPAFWFQDYTRGVDNGKEVVSANGSPEWRIRFTPTEPGRYQIRIFQQVGEHPSSVIATTNCDVGSVETGPRTWISRKGTDFTTGDGQVIRFLGENVCWPENDGTADFERYFSAMERAGENLTRLWLCPWWLPLEHQPGTLNHYSLSAAWQLDQVFATAEKHGVFFILALDHHGMFQEATPEWGGSNDYWSVNPYNRANGGPAATPNDFFTNPSARKIYQKRLRYLIGRYGYSPNLMAWEFFNEIDNVIGPGRALQNDDVVAWHRTMSGWLRDHDPFHHLITTSLTGGSDRPEYWTLPEIDFANYHSYADPNVSRYVASLSQDFLKRYDKPVLVEEFGVSAANWDRPDDPYLRGFRQGVWGAALGGSSASALPWWWHEMELDHIYPLYSAMHGILDRAGWSRGTWTRMELPTDEAPDNLGPAESPTQTFSPSLSLSDYPRRRVRGRIAIANPLAAERAGEVLSAYLLGKVDGDRQVPYRITARFADAGALSFRVDKAAKDAIVVVKLDGKEVGRASVQHFSGKGTPPPNATAAFSIPVSSGLHVIEIENLGSDWALLSSLVLQNAVRSQFANDWEFHPEAVGLQQRDARSGVVYLYGADVAFPAGAKITAPATGTSFRLPIQHWPSGDYIATWSDPQTGNVVAKTEGRSESDALQLPVPPFSDDVVGVIRPK